VRVNAEASTSQYYNDISKLQQAELEFSQTKSGPFTAPLGTAFGFEQISSTDLASLGYSQDYITMRKNQAHVEYYYESIFYPTRPTPSYPPVLNESFISITAGLLAPSSKGNVSLQSAQIQDAPTINPNVCIASVTFALDCKSRADSSTVSC
jgi:choline dehydrogenase